MPSIFEPPHAVHSAQVQIRLDAAEQSILVAQLGSDFIILEQEIALPATHGEIVMRIDSHERPWRVRLPDGASLGSERTRIVRG